MMPREQLWVERLAAEDAAHERVVSYNYQFECRHGILTGLMRERFMDALDDIRLNRPGYELPDEPSSAFFEYQTVVWADRSLWTLGQTVNVDRPLVMVKHGRTIYREHWSFLTGQSDEPGDETIVSTLGDASRRASVESREGRRLRSGSVIRHGLRELGPWRQRISDDSARGGFGELSPVEADSTDSHARYHDHMVIEGYIPIWWVTTASALAKELAGAQ